MAKRERGWWVPLAIFVGFAGLMLVKAVGGDGGWWSVLIWKVPEPIWLGLAGVALIVTGVVKRFRRNFIFALYALSMAFMTSMPSCGRTGAVRAGDVKVLQLNMEHGLEGVEKVAGLIERERPDILCLEEAGPLSFYPDRTPASLTRALAGYQVFHSTFEVVAVRGEISEARLVDIPEMESERRPVDQKVLTTALCLVKGRRVRVACLHFSPRPSPTGGFVARWAAYCEIRRAQYEGLETFIESHPSEALIVAGDFNGHPAGPNYGSLRGLMRDAFDKAGRGFGYTLTSSLPCEREDYIWSRNLMAVDCRVLSDRVSDHLALVAWLR